MNIVQFCVDPPGDTIVIDDSNAPPGLLESWADYSDYTLELQFGPEPPLTEITMPQ